MDGIGSETTEDTRTPQLRRFGVPRLLRDPTAAIGLSFLAVLVFIAVFAPVLAPAPPTIMGVGNPLEAPSAAHPAGTDLFGRDLASRVMYGARVSLSVGVVAMFFSSTIGVSIGLIAAWVGGRLDDLLMRSVDIIQVMPTLILAIALVQILGSGIHFIAIAIGVTGIPVFARLTRGQALSIQNETYITAAVALGAKPPRVMFRHILPNAFAPLTVQISLDIGYNILAEASLSFLGVGVAPPTPTWGGLLRDSVPIVGLAPWLGIFPGMAIFFTVLSFSFVGDRLRDVLDPRLRGSV